MEISLFLAKALGLYFLIVGLGMTLRGNKLRPLIADLMRNPSLVFLSGFIALFIGVFLVAIHNIWVADWRGLITIIAWLSLIKGVVRTVFPEVVLKASDAILKNDTAYYIMSVIILIIGIYLTYVGYFVSY